MTRFTGFGSNRGGGHAKRRADLRRANAESLAGKFVADVVLFDGSEHSFSRVRMVMYNLLSTVTKDEVAEVIDRIVFLQEESQVSRARFRITSIGLLPRLVDGYLKDGVIAFDDRPVQNVAPTSLIAQ